MNEKALTLNKKWLDTDIDYLKQSLAHTMEKKSQATDVKEIKRFNYFIRRTERFLKYARTYERELRKCTTSL